MKLSFAPSFRMRPISDLVLCELGEYTPEAEAVELEFDSWIPSKKNRLTPRTGGGSGLMYAEGVKKALQDLEMQARVQWGLRPRLRHPEIHFRIEAQENQDRDGIVTTLLDVLKRAGVIEDDSIARCNGLYVIFPAGPAEPGRTKAKVRILWKSASGANSPTLP